MEIKSITENKVYCVETDEQGHHNYIRNADDDWTYYDEDMNVQQLHNNKKLELLFQEKLKENNNLHFLCKSH